MPRKTPVRELQEQEEPVPSSPLRRSSRLLNSSPVPTLSTKIVSRRNSATESTTSTPKVTRGRRSSLSQDNQTNDEVEKKKPISTIRTRRSSLIEEAEEQPLTPKPRTRAGSVTKETAADAKKTPRRRKSVAEESEGEESTRKITRSKSAIKEDASEKETLNVTKPAQTPTKISAENTNGNAEQVKEVDEPNSPEEATSLNAKKKTADLDLSVISEVSFTEEQPSPKSEVKSAVNETAEQISKIANGSLAIDKESPAMVKDSPKVTTESPKVTKENLAEEDSKAKEKSQVMKENLAEEHAKAEEKVKDEKPAETPKQLFDSSVSDSSFHLNISLSVLDKSDKQNTENDKVNNKENLEPNLTAKVDEPEPMEVDDSVIGLATEKLDVSSTKVVEISLQVSEKNGDEIVIGSNEEIKLVTDEKTKEEKEVEINKSEEEKEISTIEQPAGLVLDKDESEKNETVSNQETEKSLVIEKKVEVEQSLEDVSARDKLSSTSSNEVVFNLDDEEPQKDDESEEDRSNNIKETFNKNTDVLQIENKSEEKENNDSLAKEGFQNEEKNLDLEVEKINSSNEASDEEARQIVLCSSAAQSSDEEDSYRSPVKKLRKQYSMSDDEVFTRRNTPKQRVADIFDRSIDSKYVALSSKKSTQKEESDSSSSDDEVLIVEISDEEKEAEAKSTEEIKEKEAKIISFKEIEEKPVAVELEEETEQKAEDNSLLNTSRRRKSITLQEFVPPGENAEKSLSERVHKTVDLFFSGLGNESNISVDLSLKYKEDSDEEEADKSHILEVSLTAEPLVFEYKGSKRRKIEPENVEENLEIKLENISLKSSTEKSETKNSSSEDKTPSKKRRRKKSQAKTPQTDEKSPRVSVCFDEGSIKNTSLNLSETESPKRDEKNSSKRQIPLTPFRAASTDDTSQTSSEEEGEQSLINVRNLLSVDLEESDILDGTWVPSDSDLSSESDLNEENEENDESSTCDDETEETMKLNASKKRKLFKMSKYDVAQALQSDDSDPNKKTSAKKPKKKVKASKNEKFEIETAYVVPECSEVGKKKRKAPVKSEDELTNVATISKSKDNKKFKADEKDVVKGKLMKFKPTSGERKNAKPLKIKPSTLVCDGWEVSNFS